MRLPSRRTPRIKGGRASCSLRRTMDPITAPVPLGPPARADLRSHLHRRLQEAAKGAPHLPHGLLIHALWDGGYARDAFSKSRRLRQLPFKPNESSASDTEFIVQAKRDVQRVKDRLLSKLPGVLCDTFHVSWRFGEAYRGLLKEYWRISAILPPSNGEWTREESSAQRGMEDDGRTAVHFHVREDLAQVRVQWAPAAASHALTCLRSRKR